MRKYSPDICDRSAQMSYKTKIVNAYGKWISDEIDDSWKAYFLTFTFKQLNRAYGTTLFQMEDAIDRFYRTLVTRFVRNPTSPSYKHLLPRLNAFPDVPYLKNKKYQYGIQEVTVNGGLHLHGILRIPESSRFNGDLRHYLAEKEALYVRYPLHKIDIDEITSRPEYVTDYAFKALKTGRIDPDRMMIWPKSVSELSEKQWRQEWREPLEICHQPKATTTSLSAASAGAMVSHGCV
jgi:hypothetical protein